MSPAARKIRHLLERSRKAQNKRDCASAYHALLQAVRAYGYASGSDELSPSDAGLSEELHDQIVAVFDGCIGG